MLNDENSDSQPDGNVESAHALVPAPVQGSSVGSLSPSAISAVKSTVNWTLFGAFIGALYIPQTLAATRQMDPKNGRYWGWFPALISATANGLLTPLVTKDLFSPKSWKHLALYWFALVSTFGLLGSPLASPTVAGVVESLTILLCGDHSICPELPRDKSKIRELLTNTAMADEVLGETTFKFIESTGNIALLLQGIFMSMGLMKLIEKIYPKILKLFKKNLPPETICKKIEEWIDQEGNEETIKSVLYINGNQDEGLNSHREIYAKISKWKRYLPDGIGKAMRQLLSIGGASWLGYILSPEIPEAIFYSREGVVLPLPGFGIKEIDEAFSKEGVSTALGIFANALLFGPIIYNTLPLLYKNLDAIFDFSENSISWRSKLKIFGPLFLTLLTLLTVLFQGDEVNFSFETCLTAIVALIANYSGMVLPENLRCLVQQIKGQPPPYSSDSELPVARTRAMQQYHKGLFFQPKQNQGPSEEQACRDARDRLLPSLSIIDSQYATT
ncbi:hypothetical protein [Candidiatus Paracoxiella cheracis]|uniref:hypothetical protein n=1 Tax=Candidiatus Paracoxiella cheracis TaxID=3405120 RepID=UPI003BF580A8